jgi:hypothetical protein
MAPRIEELDVIKTLVPLEGPDVFDDARIFQLPAGSRGTVVYDFGDAYEVEFLVWPTPEHYRSVQIPVNADQCELDWKCPA